MRTLKSNRLSIIISPILWNCLYCTLTITIRWLLLLIMLLLRFLGIYTMKSRMLPPVIIARIISCFSSITKRDIMYRSTSIIIHFININFYLSMPLHPCHSNTISFSRIFWGSRHSLNPERSSGLWFLLNYVTIFLIVAKN